MEMYASGRKPPFWLDLCGKLGGPVFGASLVGCLLMGDFEPMHGVPLAAGAALMIIHHVAS